MNVTVKCGMENIDFEKAAKLLAESYWSPGIKAAEVKQAASHSALVVGAFLDDGTMAAYGRVISDRTRFAYLSDFYVETPYRRMGICSKMLAFVLNHPSLKDVYQWLLKTRDAHDVYAKFGFKPLADPDGFMEIRGPRPQR